MESIAQSLSQLDNREPFHGRPYTNIDGLRCQSETDSPRYSYTHFLRTHYIGPIGLDPSRYIQPPEMHPDETQGQQSFERQLKAHSWLIAHFGIGPDATEDHPASPHIAFIPPRADLSAYTMITDLDDATRSANAHSAGIPIEEYPHKAVTIGPAFVLDLEHRMMAAIGPHKSQNVADLLLRGFHSEASASLINLSRPGHHHATHVYLDHPAAQETMSRLGLS